jgi:hypothetical protein
MDLKIFLVTPPWDWPRDAGKTFRKVLMDQRAEESDRLIAAELAGDFTVIDDDLSDVLLAIVGNPKESEQLRAKAAISFGPALEQGDLGFEDPDDVPITEFTFHKIQNSLRKLYMDTSNPKEVRRRILEASVRAPEPWHQEAVREAYSSGDQEWVLTAVFSMCQVRGFDEQILASLKSDDPDIHFEAIRAAGNWQLDAAWSHVVGLVQDARTPKSLLIAAIGAVGSIRPAEALELLVDLADSKDEEIADAADEALMMAETLPDDEDGEENEEEEWIN